jgi:hypothetical protein
VLAHSMQTGNDMRGIVCKQDRGMKNSVVLYAAGIMLSSCKRGCMQAPGQTA